MKAETEVWFVRAESTWLEGKTLFENHLIGGAVSRVYFACFYSVLAYLTEHGHSAKSHNGVKTLFNKTLIQTGHLERKYGELYNDLFELRLEADYVPDPRYLEDEIEPMISGAATFIEQIRTLMTTTL